MNTDFIKMLGGTVARGVLVSVGGWLMHKGIVDQAGDEQFVSAGMVIVGIGWSAWQKYGAIIVKAELEQLATNAQLRLDRLQAAKSAPVNKAGA